MSICMSICMSTVAQTREVKSSILEMQRCRRNRSENNLMTSSPHHSQHNQNIKNIYVHVSMNVYACACATMHVCMYVCMFVCMCKCTFECTCLIQLRESMHAKLLDHIIDLTEIFGTTWGATCRTCLFVSMNDGSKERVIMFIYYCRSYGLRQE